MGLGHYFRGVSGKEYEYRLKSIEHAISDTVQPGTYILATSEAHYPGFLFCREAGNLRDALIAANLPKLRALHDRLILYVRVDVHNDKALRDAEVEDITRYYRGSWPSPVAEPKV